MESPPCLNDWELNNFLYDVASSLDERVFADMKYLCTGEGGIGRGDLDRLETPFKFFLHLRQMDMISKDNFLLLQALLSKVHRVDLHEKASSLAQTRGNILHFHKPKKETKAIEEGFQHARLHVQGSFETYRRPALDELRKYVAKLLAIKEEFVFLSGVELQDSGSLVLTFLIHKDYANKLTQLFLEHSQGFASLKVHNIHVDVIQEIDCNQGLASASDSKEKSQEECAQFPRDMKKDLHLLLVGRTGVGKSSTGNSILGRKAFESFASMSSVTKTCQKDVEELQNGRKMYVVDTLGASDTCYSEEEGKFLFVFEITRAIAMSPLGYDAILLTFRFGSRFTQEDANILIYLKQVFGENFVKEHCIVIMTCGDLYKSDEDLENTPFIDWCKMQEGKCKDLLEEVNDRVILFNNRASDNEKATQRQELVETVDKLMKSGCRYTDEHFEKARREMDRILKEKRDDILTDELKDETSLILAQLAHLKTEDRSKDIDEQINALTVLKFRSKIQLDNIKEEEGTPLLLKMQGIIQNAHDKIDQEICILTLTKELEQRRLLDEGRASNNDNQAMEHIDHAENISVKSLTNEFQSVRDDSNDTLTDSVVRSLNWGFGAIVDWFK